MNFVIKFDEERLKELVEEAAEQIKKDMCADCPYKSGADKKGE
ncbi:MAG: hypothetical protein ACI3T9_01320 [Romboutsia timonensis]